MESLKADADCQPKTSKFISLIVIFKNEINHKRVNPRRIIDVANVFRFPLRRVSCLSECEVSECEKSFTGLPIG